MSCIYLNHSVLSFYLPFTGKSTGIVTTSRINHASPSGNFAHTANRKWYADVDLTQKEKAMGCKDIAQQFYDQSDMIDVSRRRRIKIEINAV